MQGYDLIFDRTPRCNTAWQNLLLSVKAAAWKIQPHNRKQIYSARKLALRREEKTKNLCKAATKNCTFSWLTICCALKFNLTETTESKFPKTLFMFADQIKREIDLKRLYGRNLDCDFDFSASRRSLFNESKG